MAVEKNIDIGFSPVLSAKPRVLILGTMPSVKSLEEQQYYGHPRNAFWWVMSQVCGFPNDLAYEEKVEQVKSAGVTIWDVAHSCHRPGSLDSNIDQSTLKANDIVGLLRQYPAIELIVFNGQAAAKLFRKFIGDLVDTKQIVLPSTSPANAAMAREEKLEKWSILKDYL